MENNFSAFLLGNIVKISARFFLHGHIKQVTFLCYNFFDSTKLCERENALQD